MNGLGLGRIVGIATLFFSLSGWGLDLPPNTRPMFVPDPVLPLSGPPGFGCFGACGPSCDCIGHVQDKAVTCQGGKRCEWTTIQCKTHSFCRWHDGCHRSCDIEFPGRVDDGSTPRTLCYRSCDLSCADGKAPEIPGGWRHGKPPGAPPEALGTLTCLLRLADAPGVEYDDDDLVFAGFPKCHDDAHCK